MKTKGKKDTSLSAFIQEAKDKNKEEIKNILEMREILAQLLGAEERSQIYQLKVTSNW